MSCRKRCDHKCCFQCEFHKPEYKEPKMNIYKNEIEKGCCECGCSCDWIVEKLGGQIVALEERVVGIEGQILEIEKRCCPKRPKPCPCHCHCEKPKEEYCDHEEPDLDYWGACREIGLR